MVRALKQNTYKNMNFKMCCHNNIYFMIYIFNKLTEQIVFAKTKCKYFGMNRFTHNFDQEILV